MTHFQHIFIPWAVCPGILTAIQVYLATHFSITYYIFFSKSIRENDSICNALTSGQNALACPCTVKHTFCIERRCSLVSHPSCKSTDWDATSPTECRPTNAIAVESWVKKSEYEVCFLGDFLKIYNVAGRERENRKSKNKEERENQRSKASQCCIN